MAAGTTGTGAAVAVSVSSDVKGFESGMTTAIQGLCEQMSRSLNNVIEDFSKNLAGSFVKGIQQGQKDVTGGSLGGMTSGPSASMMSGGVPSTASSILGRLNNITQPYIPADLGPMVTPEAHREQFNKTAEDVRRLSQAKSAGMDVSPYTQKIAPQLQEYRTGLQSALQEAVDPEKSEQRKKEEGTLISEIQKLTKAMETAVGQDKEKLQQDKHLKTEELEVVRQKGNIGAIVQELGAVNTVSGGGLDPREKQQREQQQRIGQIAGGIGTALSLVGSLPGQYRSGQIGSSEVENLESRAAGSGDLMRQIAIQKSGGQGAIQSQATLESLGSLGASAAGLAGGIAGSIYGGVAAPAAAGLALQQGGQLASGIAGFGNLQREKAESILSREMGVNKEEYEMYSAGMGQDIKGFSMGRRMGTGGLGTWLSGGEDRGMATFRGGGIQEADRMAVRGGQSIVKYAGDIGMWQDERMQLQGQVAQGGAGAFGTQTPWITNRNVEMGDLMKSQTQGFSGVGGVAAQMIRGGERSESGMKRAMAETKDLWIELIASGVDRTTASKSLEKMGNEAGRLGAAQQARIELQTQTEMATKVFGKEKGEEQMGFMKDFMDNMKRQTQGGSTMMQAAGMNAASKLATDIEKITGRKIKQRGAFEFGVQSVGVSPETIAAQITDQDIQRKFGKGKTLSPEDLKKKREEITEELMSAHTRAVSGEGLKFAKGAGPSGFGEVALAQQQGTTPAGLEAIRKISSLEGQITKASTPEERKILQDKKKEVEDKLDVEGKKFAETRGAKDLTTATKIEASKAAAGLSTFTERANAANAALAAFTTRLNEVFYKSNAEDKERSETYGPTPPPMSPAEKAIDRATPASMDWG